MDKVFFISTLLLCVISVRSQEKPFLDELGISIQNGSAKMTKMKEGIYKETSPVYAVNLYYNTIITDKLRFSPAIKFEVFKLNTNGYFNQVAEEISFTLTPTMFQQNQLVLRTISFPLYLSTYKHYSEQKLITIGGGPMFRYFGRGYQRYLFESKSNKEEIHVDQRVAFCTGLDIHMLFRVNKWSMINLGVGGDYQITDFLQHDRSFILLSGYFTIGISKIK